MRFKVDKGAQTNVMSLKLYNDLTAELPCSSSIWLLISTREKMQVCGKFNLSSEYWNKRAFLGVWVVVFETSHTAPTSCGKFECNTKS